MAEKSMVLSIDRTEALREVLKSQYRAATAMLAQAIEQCPDDLWTSDAHKNRFWHVAYHTLFYMHLYLQPSLPDFKPWEKHREEYQYLGAVPGPLRRPAEIGEPYSKTEVMEYFRICVSMIDSALDRIDLGSHESGFYWYKMSKLEHQILGIRHIQHHAAQLSDRLRAASGEGVAWIGGKPAE